MDETYVTFVKYTIFLIIICTQVTSQCIQNSPCSCTLPDGSGFDFSSLEKQGLVFCDMFFICQKNTLRNRAINECSKIVVHFSF